MINEAIEAILLSSNLVEYICDGSTFCLFVRVVAFAKISIDR